MSSEVSGTPVERSVVIASSCWVFDRAGVADRYASVVGS